MISKKMITKAKVACSAYQNTLEAKWKTGDADKQERARKRKLDAEITNCWNLKRRKKKSNIRLNCMCWMKKNTKKEKVKYIR